MPITSMTSQGSTRRGAQVRTALFTLAIISLALITLPARRCEAQDAQPGASSARAMVRATLDQVLLVLAEPDWTSDQRVAAIEKIAYARFDFSAMSKLVLGKANYKRFSKDQLAEFRTQFRAYLSRTYGGRVDRYEQREVEIIGDRLLKRGNVLVQTEIKGGSANGIMMDYVLRDDDGEWKVIDVVIEGVSLVRNFRSQFKEIMNGENGPEELLRELRDKNGKKNTA